MNNSAIEWTDTTWNPVTGCTKVSQGCKNCYAERMFARPYPGRDFTDVQLHPDRLQAPLHLVKGRRIFVNSMSDLFHESVPFEFIADVFAVMACTTRHTYQILTKRPQRMLEWFEWLRHSTDLKMSMQEADRVFGKGYAWPEQVDATKVWPQWTVATAHRGGYDNCGPIWPLTNVWLGVSVEDQTTADERIPLLLETPSAVRFISAEPLLGPIDIVRSDTLAMTKCVASGKTIERGLDLVIAGGESGPHARPSHPDWFRSLRDQCAAAGTAFFFKQWGEWAPGECSDAPLTKTERTAEWFNNAWDFGSMTRSEAEGAHRDDEPDLFRVGKKAAGRTLDGREHSELPA